MIISKIIESDYIFEQNNFLITTMRYLENPASVLELKVSLSILGLLVIFVFEITKILKIYRLSHLNSKNKTNKTK